MNLRILNEFLEFLTLENKSWKKEKHWNNAWVESGPWLHSAGPTYN
jgi:hypothetical protein